MNNKNAVLLAGNYLKKCLGIAMTKEEQKREESMKKEIKGWNI